MKEHTTGGKLGRRRFLGLATAAATGTAMGLGVSVRATEGKPGDEGGRKKAETPKKKAPVRLEERNKQPGMTYAQLGSTGLMVSRVSFGCVQLQDDRLAALEAAVERGVNYVHLSSGYNGGKAITAFGKFSKENRDKVWIGLKCNPDEKQIDKALKLLRTDHIDIICPSMNSKKASNANLRERFEELRKAGKVRFLCWTNHHDPVSKHIETAAEMGCFDCIMPVLNLGNLEAFRKSVGKLTASNTAAVAMKSMKDAGHKKPAEVVRALLAAGAATVLKTLNTLDDVEAYLSAVAKPPSVSDLRRGLRSAAELIAAGGVCTFCGECDQCPNGVAVIDAIRDYTYYHEQLGLPEIFREHYGELRLRETAMSCQDCGQCDRLCPQGIPVRAIVREAYRAVRVV